MADASEMSKSAKKRAAKKARDEAHAAEEAPAPAAAPKAAAKAAAGSGYPEPKAKAKAKAEPKADPAPKAKAKAKAEPAPAPAAAEPKAKAKAEPKAKASGKAKAKPAPAPEPKPEPSEFGYNATWKAEDQIDDGTGGAWDVSTGKTKKKERQEQRKAEEKKLAAANPKAVNDRYIPGLAGAPANVIPGMAPAGANNKATVNQSVNATAAAAAAAAKAAAADAAKTEAAGPASFASVHVPEKRIGIVIGPGGSKIKLIQEKTGAKIDTEGETFTISGPPEGVKQAEKAVQDLVSKGYTELAFDDFSENYVMVPGQNFPDLIGKQGCIVQAIKKELNVEVTFPPTSGIKGDTKKYKVTMAGSQKAVEKCKEVITDIVNYGHHEVTHPGEAHEEIEVPEWCYAAIIGKKGCELRHLQNSYKVRAIIPRETSAIQNVILVGEAHQLPRAKAYVEKALYNFQNQVKGRDRSDGGKAEDPWGEEEPEEPWMKQYMYKR